MLCWEDIEALASADEISKVMLLHELWIIVLNVNASHDMTQLAEQDGAEPRGNFTRANRNSQKLSEPRRKIPPRELIVWGARHGCRKRWDVEASSMFLFLF